MKLRIIAVVTLFFSPLVLGAPKQIVCDYLVDEHRCTNLEFCSDYGLKVGDVWSTGTYVFDTADFESTKKTADYSRWIITRPSKTQNRSIEYTVSPTELVFDSTAEYPHRISRKTLSIKDHSEHKCRLEDVDTSENLL